MTYIPNIGNDSPIVPIPPATPRTAGTVYQNLTGRPILVSVVYTAANVSTYVDAFCDSTNPPTTSIASRRAPGTLVVASIWFPVPPLHYYKVDATAGSITAINQWTEHILPGSGLTRSAPARTLNTVYQNASTTDPLFVLVTQFLNADTSILCDAANPPTIGVMQEQMNSRDILLCIVPPQNYYKIAANAGNAIISWYEWAWAGLKTCILSPSLTGRTVPVSGTSYGPGAQAGMFVSLSVYGANPFIACSQNDVIGGYNTGDSRVIGSITSAQQVTGGNGSNSNFLYVPPGAAYNWYASTAPTVLQWREWTVK